MNREVTDEHLEVALKQFGSLGARIMREIWEGRVEEPFTVRTVLARMPDLAYNTVMTILSRLATRGLLTFTPASGRNPYQYRVAMDPERFLAWSIRRDAQRMVERYGDLALSAFADELEQLTPEERERLRTLIGH
jgi:predicted transcriptional regulator